MGDPIHRMWRNPHLLPRLTLHGDSIDNYPSVFNMEEALNPGESYHLADQSFVSFSSDDEFSTMSTNISGTRHILCPIKQKAFYCRFYFSGLSEMFGQDKDVPNDENTTFYPRPLYGISKVAGFDLTRNYWEVYGLICLSGILFNYESPRRGFELVTRKVSTHASMVKLGMTDHIRPGYLEAKRDWSHTQDYVHAMWLMLQQANPDDYVIATGENHFVKEFLQAAFEQAGLDYQKHKGVDEELYRPSRGSIEEPMNFLSRGRITGSQK